MNLILDNDNTQIIQVLNDTFYNIYYGEEPLDDKCLEEIAALQIKFEYGFHINNYTALKNTGLVELEIIPYIKKIVNIQSYDEYLDLTSEKQLQIKWIDSTTVKAYIFKTKVEEQKEYGKFKVYTNAYGNKCFHTGPQDKEFEPGKMSLYFLKNFKKV